MGLSRLLMMNFASGIIFALDKNAAINSRRRISEQTLHLLEILGGVFVNVLLMYTLRHKNRKFGYWIWTWMVLIGWVSIITILIY